MKIQRILIILIIGFLILFAVIFWMGWEGYQLQKEEVLITIDKTEYEAGENLKVKIKNNFREQICFSSCYPYLLERKNEKWESYKYVECQRFHGNGYCIEAKKEKDFELTLPQVPDGLHRLVIPICISCKSEDTFKEDKRFYLNEFTIKEKKIDETTDWKTYRNEEYGYEVKYPMEWEKYFLISKNKISWKIPDEIICGKACDIFHTISIEVYKKNYTSTGDWLKELNTSVPEEAYPPDYKIDREITISGLAGLEVSQESEGGLYTKVGVIKNNFVYEFTKLKTNWEKNESIDKEFYQMLSTFRFLE